MKLRDIDHKKILIKGLLLKIKNEVREMKLGTDPTYQNAVDAGTLAKNVVLNKGLDDDRSINAVLSSIFRKDCKQYKMLYEQKVDISPTKNNKKQS